VRPLLVDLSSRRVVVIAALVSTLLLLAVSWTGWMDALELSLRMVMRSRPLPSGYFQVFIVAGTLLPLVLRTVFRRNVLVSGLLDPYLILLLGQIICELLMVLLVGPGLGVGPDVPAYGGYQQLFRVEPNNVGAYRLTTLPGRSGPAHSVTGGAPTLAGRVNHKAPPKTAFLPTRRPEVQGRAQGQGGALTGVTVRSKYEKTKRPTNRSETTWRNDGLEFNPARSVVSAPTLAEDPTRNKGDLNDRQFQYNNQPVPGITNFFGGYLEAPASQLLEESKGNKGYSTAQLEQYGFRPDDRRGKKDRSGNPGRMNVRAGPLNQGGMVTAVRTDCNKYDGRMGPVNGGWTQNYVQDKYYQFNAYKGQVNPYATSKELNVAKNQLKNNPLAHSISA